MVGDDRVRGTREQMMLLHVVMVRLSHRAGKAWEFCILQFEIKCKHYGCFILF